MVLAEDAPLNPPDYNTLYTPGEKGYTDYPTLESVLADKNEEVYA